MLVVATSPHGFVAIVQDEATLSQELRTVRLLQPHVLVGYQWQNTGLRPRFIESQQLRKQPHVATLSEPCVRLVTAHGSPCTCALRYSLSGRVPACSKWWHRTQRTNVFLCRAIIIFCHISFPLATSFSFRTWWTSNGPCIASQYSHICVFNRRINSERQSVSANV